MDGKDNSPKHVPRPRLLKPPKQRYVAIQPAPSQQPGSIILPPHTPTEPTDQQPVIPMITQDLPAAKKPNPQQTAPKRSNPSGGPLVSPKAARYLKLVPKSVKPVVNKAVQFRARKRIGQTKDDEQILIRTHMHWIFLVRSAALPVLLTVVSTGGIIGIAAISSQPALLFALILVLIPAALIWLAYYEWLNDEYIITNHRVIDVRRQLANLDRRTEISVEMVQDVRSSVQNFWQKLLNYGNVIIDNAGQGSSVTFTNISNPDQIRDIVWNAVIPMREEALRKKRDEQKQRLMDAIVAEDEPITVGPGKERDIAVWRKSIYILVWKLLRPALLLVLSVVAFVIALTLLKGLELYSLAAFVVILLIGIGWTTWEYIDWENDRYILTDRRIIYEYRIAFPIAVERRTDMLLSRVQDVRTEVNGFLEVALNFGNVSIESAAGQVGKITFLQIEDPVEVAKKINDQIKQLREREEERKLREHIVTARAAYQMMRADAARLEQALHSLESQQPQVAAQPLTLSQQSFSLLPPPPRPAVFESDLAPTTDELDDGLGPVL